WKSSKRRYIKKEHASIVAKRSPGTQNMPCATNAMTVCIRDDTGMTICIICGKLFQPLFGKLHNPLRCAVGI
ncbi:MAG: hypothetical protein IKR66_04525, partial [Bacteroidales bacterium]|nr:hypothetical protein [Bacteroidales bacterium]